MDRGGEEHGRFAIDEAYSPIFESIRELESVAGVLRRLGPIVLLVTLANVGTLLWAIVQSVQGAFVEFEEALALLNIVMAMGTIACVGWFETMRRRGDAIFQEVSDELQWHVGRAEYREAPPTRPLLKARVALRTFSAAAQLPLIAGPFGATGYAALNLAIALTSAFVLRA